MLISMPADPVPGAIALIGVQALSSRFLVLSKVNLTYRRPTCIV